MTFAFLKASASVLGATGVMAGALGAHALHDTLVKRNMLRQYQTAVLYQVLHAAALVGVSSMMQDSSNKKLMNPLLLSRAGYCMVLGTTLFSGSIYLLIFDTGNVIPRKVLGPMTPLGGLFMIGGWVLLGLA
jgi:uncharacterized membrane protein YgdD (TMEM256/DUF423 family)